MIVFFMALLLLLSPNVANAQQNTYYATEELNVRSGPGMGYSIIGSLDEGESVTLLRLSGKWARISYQGGREGYAFFAYLSPRSDQGAQLYATTDLNVRKGPGMSYSIIGSLDEGEAVTKIRSVGNWALVLHQGKQVYVFEKYLSLAYSVPAADPLPMQFATLIDPLALYEDAAGTTLLTHLKYYGGNQRVVILEDLGDMKKIAVYGYAVYAKAEDLANYSDTYSAQRDAQALYNYNLTTTGESYRETYKNNPYYGGFGYDSSDNTCVLFFKQGHMPSIGLDGTLRVNPDEANVVRWIFEQYQLGQSLGKIADGLAQQKIPSPTGKAKWNREAIDKLLSNEKIQAEYFCKRRSARGFLRSTTPVS